MLGRRLHVDLRAYDRPRQSYTRLARSLVATPASSLKKYKDFGLLYPAPWALLPTSALASEPQHLTLESVLLSIS